VRLQVEQHVLDVMGLNTEQAAKKATLNRHWGSSP
jgi:hypothetical protein